MFVTPTAIILPFKTIFVDGSNPSLATAPVCRLWETDRTCLCSLLQIILWVQILLGQLCDAYSNHLDITVNYETKSIMKNLWDTYSNSFLNKILGEYFIFLVS